MRHCYFCNNGIRHIDYKDIETLKKFINPHARVINHRVTAICAHHQRRLTQAIKRARFLALLPYIAQ